MKNFSRKLGLLTIGLMLAITLALLSASVERVGPELVAYGNLCGASKSELCYKPVLKGGFPFSYLFDAPGVSVEDQLSFGEDKVNLPALAANIAVYLVVLLMVWARWRRRAAG